MSENCRNEVLFQVRVVISSAVPHKQLFLTGQQEDFSDEHRKLMDDLDIQHGSVSVFYHSPDMHLLSVTETFTSSLFSASFLPVTNGFAQKVKKDIFV